MTRIKELQQEERLLIEKEATIDLEAKQLKRIQEDYRDQFREATRFFDRLNDHFQRSKECSFFESLADDFSHKTRQIMERLELDGDELHLQKRAIERQRDALDYEKKQATTEDSNHEY